MAPVDGRVGRRHVTPPLRPTQSLWSILTLASLGDLQMIAAECPGPMPISERERERATDNAHKHFGSDVITILAAQSIVANLDGIFATLQQATPSPTTSLFLTH